MALGFLVIFTLLPETMKKKLLILDLDETLIHATKTPKDNLWNFKVYNYKVYKRPFLAQFLQEIQKYYRIAVWSSASDDYVEAIVQHIFPKNYPLVFVWGNSKCTPRVKVQDIDDLGYIDYFNHLNYTKILKKVYKKGFAAKEDTLIVDDTPAKVIQNYGNAIYPIEFTGNQNDEELKRLLQYLINIKNTVNFRTLEKRNWRETLKNINQ